MSQPIDVGTVLGGRYKVTSTVRNSADGDMVLDGMDQVLNRAVSILVATTDNTARMTASAREIATGERPSNVQVLDLGVSEDATYLITNTADSDDLMDLFSEATYVEPFYTDTLGSEIFGEQRSMRPELHEDDDEYYAELEENERRTPLSNRLAGFRDRLSRGVAGVTGGAAAAGAGSGAASAAPEPQDGADTAGSPSTEESPVAAPAPAEATGTSPKVEVYDDTDEDDDHAVPAAAAAAAGPAPTASTPRAGADEDLRPAATFPAAARGYEDEAAVAGAGAGAGAAAGDDVYEDDEEEEGGNRWTRLIVGAVLGIVLILAVVFAFNMLGGLGGDDAPQAGGDSSTSAGNGEPSASQEPGSSEDPAETAAPAASPVVSGIDRVVPDFPSLNEETDNTLGRAIDGNEATLYASFSYTQPNFGGYASNMILVAELEESAEISQVELTGLNGTGGSFEVAIGETDDFSSAQSVTQGSFTGPTVSVPVTDEEAATGRYVFFNVTELPRLASPYDDARPYGLQVAEFKVS
ncbi:hypothetical protein [Zhihengliuella salsuginis]|uniref:ABC transporter substrate-binding protein n=1 Tax=Zhihengliuella salsuginis TaxID=578222 RepID=A0ABQ3GKM1_9MICC|nr:hypothetical protein [Zhihengliuella salsuginis]GHD11397.1 hypothetical protein GCM10008096_25990 [Zhihengliuella salsuginis]